MTHINISDELTNLVETAINGAGYSGVVEDTESVQPTKNPRFGDFQSNQAFRVGKALRTNPRAVAQAVVDSMPEHPGVLEVSVAGPGFLNFKLKEKWLAQ